MDKARGYQMTRGTAGKDRAGTHPRYQNGNLRRKHRARLKAMGCECGICNGRLGPIRYDQPSNAQHPLSFVIDEIRPVSRWQEFGYESPAAAAQVRSTSLPPCSSKRQLRRVILKPPIRAAQPPL